MNYIKLYENFINYCTQTNYYDRLLQRNPKDLRIINNMQIYTENHHILPKALGGKDTSENMVKLLPEEHLFAHIIRYKAYRERCDFIAVKFIINGFNNSKKLSENRICLSRKLRNSYTWLKQNSSNFRKGAGWQSPEGRIRISLSRKGTFPVKDVLTDEIIGSFDKNHEKIISGEWVHHSKGKHKFYNKKTGEGVYCARNDLDGLEDWVSASNKNNKSNQENNPRYSGISDTEIYEFYYKVAVIIEEKYKLKKLPGLKLVKLIWDYKYNSRPFPNLGGGEKSGFRFGGDVKTNLILSISNKLNLEYNERNKLKYRINVKEVSDAID